MTDRDKLLEMQADCLGRGFLIGFIVGAFMLLLGMLCGCTVTPGIVRSAEVSFDGNGQNSGLIGTNEVGDAIYTEHAIRRYERLMAAYGGRWGITNCADGVRGTETNTFLLDRQHRFYFATANRWSKSDTNFVRLP